MYSQFLIYIFGTVGGKKQRNSVFIMILFFLNIWQFSFMRFRNEPSNQRPRSCGKQKKTLLLTVGAGGIDHPHGNRFIDNDVPATVIKSVGSPVHLQNQTVEDL